MSQSDVDTDSEDGLGMDDSCGPVEDPINTFSRLELTNYLLNTLLRDADVMSMRHSLEVRVPLVDHLLIETLSTVPGTLKLGPSESKPLLRMSAPSVDRYVPTKAKRGFVLPLDEWLRGALKPRAWEMLEPDPHADGVVDRTFVRQAWNRFEQGDSSMNATRVWSLLILRDWCARQRVS
jgi:asparagine synthase (glutamine-hydrolysing)